MASVKWNSPGPRAVLSVAAFLTASTAAMADPTTLVCSNTSRPDFAQVAVDLNEASGTATITLSGGISSGPSISWGSSAAKFDSKSVTFDYFRNDVEHHHYLIDRLTGVMLDYIGFRAPYDQAGPDHRGIYRYSCEVGHAKF